MSESTSVVPLNEIQVAAKLMGDSGLFGKTIPQIAALMLIANAEGIHIASAAMEYDIIQNKPCLNSRSAQSRFQKSGGTVEWVTSTETECTAIFSHPRSPKPLTISWDIKRAALAGISGKDTWKKYPAQMLRARVIAEGVRAVYPACLNTMYLIEELQDVDNGNGKQAPVPTQAVVTSLQEPVKPTKPVEAKPEAPKPTTPIKQAPEAPKQEPAKKVEESMTDKAERIFGEGEASKPKEKPTEVPVDIEKPDIEDLMLRLAACQTLAEISEFKRWVKAFKIDEKLTKENLTKLSTAFRTTQTAMAEAEQENN